MPETARILNFPRPQSPLGMSRAEACERANEYLLALESGISAEGRRNLLRAPDVLLAVCGLLREKIDACAAVVSAEAQELYRAIANSTERIGGFDERDFFLGELALLAGTASRIIGRRGESELWLDRAEAGFRQTVNPAPLLSRVTYQRLSSRCESGRYEEVAELAPMLAATFSRLGMVRDEAKCVFLHGVSLKELGRSDAALAVFVSLARVEVLESEPGLVGFALVSAAELEAAEGRDDLANEYCSKALPLLRKANKPAALAHLKATIGEILQRQGKIAAAVEAYASAASSYEDLGMATWVAYLRVVMAQALLQAGRPREAEWQILKALPTIEEQEMAPEAAVAIGLLRESVRSRETDLTALTNLRIALRNIK